MILRRNGKHRTGPAKGKKATEERNADGDFRLVHLGLAPGQCMKYIYWEYTPTPKKCGRKKGK